MTGDPPSSAGGDHDTVATPFPAVAATSVGAPGTVAAAAGVTVTGVEVGLSPFTFVAMTTTVYSVPLVSPVRTQDVVPAAPNVVHSSPPGVACAV